jgi:hypothetical protein
MGIQTVLASVVVLEPYALKGARTVLRGEGVQQ